jgi:GAF domain-containing protein
MDVADAHHAAVVDALRGGAAPAVVMRAAGELLLEALSAFEMLRRGLAEVREDAERERRHAAILRQLSSFLADASLALSGEACIHEILHLLTEQARELIGADCCMATVGAENDAAGARAASFAPEDVAVGARLALADLSPLEAVAGSVGPVARMDPCDWLASGLRDSLEGRHAIRSWLAVPLARLDGRPRGFLHAFDRRPRAFTSADGDVLLQLAQMGSAALERIDLYARADADA